MPELRYNLISREWVIIARERAKRPKDFSKPLKDKIALPEFKKDCPFCPGNEDKTPPETFRLQDKNSWRVRVTSNKFPALSPEEKHDRVMKGMFRSMSGFGVHEVIIDHPRHNAFIPFLSEKEIADIISVYRQRHCAIQQIEHIEAIVIFKNHGAQAGTSLEHPHSQLIATPIVPPQIRSRFDRSTHYFDETGRCIFCQTLEEELAAGERIVTQTSQFVSFIPYAELSPFHIWIFPRRHCASFADIQDKEIDDLAR
ncbi:MAG: galactose-1-phosphate uridylyltransferase, partial [Candidatus Omnitrophica bacterium]|nr:galactose-1-phosphate uridylyltransferase [Candidatus Omnitrophota bacterium]